MEWDMKLKEIRELIKLANDLDAKGLYREADGLDFIILKMSMALENMHGGSEVENLGRSDYDYSAPGGHSRGSWFDSIKALKAPVVLIHVDYNKILGDAKTFDRFKKLFSLSPNYDPRETYDSVLNVFGYSSCDASKFFKEFENDMPSIASNYRGKYDKYAFVLWDTQSVGSSTRTPDYLGHDLNHAENEGPEESLHGNSGLIMYKIKSLLSDCYEVKKVEGEDDLNPEVKSIFIMKSLLGNKVIKDTTLMGDAEPDILGFIASGGSLFDELIATTSGKIPRSMTYSSSRRRIGSNSPIINKYEILLNCDQSKVEDIIRKADAMLKRYVSGEGESNLISEQMSSEPYFSGRDPEALQFMKQVGRVVLLP